VTGTLIQPTIIKDILTGILLCLLIIATMHIMPLIGIFAWVVLPLPILFYRLKTGRKGGGLIMVASLALLILFTSNFAFNILYFGSLLMTGFFLGEFLEKHLAVERIMIYTSLWVLGICMAVLLIYSTAKTQGIVTLISNYAERYQTLSAQLFSESAQLYPDMKVDPNVLEKAGSMFAMVFPGVFINSYLTMAWLNILFIKKILSRKGIIIKSIENLNQWKAPDYLVFGVIGLSILLFLPVGGFKLLAVNGLIILMFVYFFQGIAVVSYLFQKKSAPLGLRFFFYILIALQPLFMFLVIGFGLFDTWFNFRKLGNAT